MERLPQNENESGLVPTIESSGTSTGSSKYRSENKKVSHIRLEASNLLIAIREHDPVADEEDLFWLQAAIDVLDRLTCQTCSMPWGVS